MNTNHSSYQQQKFSVTNIGSVTLMMIFIVLCMVTFAALSLSSASYDWRSAKKSADHTTAYYQTSNQAETILSDIDQMLTDCRSASNGNALRSSDPSYYYQQVKFSCEKWKEPVLSFHDDANVADPSVSSLPTISYQVPISDSQVLQVVLSLLNPYETQATAKSTDSDSFYRITAWQVLSTKEWNGDNSLKLMQP